MPTKHFKKSRCGAGNPNYHGGPLEIICAVCGKSFKARRTPRGYAKAKYCSLVCSKIGRSKKISIKCPICGKEFLSKPCQAHYRRTCSHACKYEYSKQRTGPQAGNWQGGWDDYYGDNWLSQRAHTLKRDNYTCQSCGIVESECKTRLHVHHIRPFQHCANYLEANQLSNLVALCQSCHYKTDAKWRRENKGVVVQRKLCL